MRLKRVAALSVGLIALFGVSGFTYPNPPPAAVVDGGAATFPDPAVTSMRMIDTNPQAAWLFSTQNNQYLNIVTLPFNAVTGAATSTSDFAALNPTFQGNTLSLFFAPSVDYLNGQWVMWFSGSGPNGQPNCLYSATDPGTVAAGAFTNVSDTCIGAAGEGLFDPSIWINPDGSLWLLYSEESTNGSTTSTQIFSQQLVGNGTTLAGSPNATTLATYGQVSSSPNFPHSYPNSENPEIENPQFTLDPQSSGHFDMLLSYGAYKYANSYITAEMSCTSITGPCANTNAQALNLAGTQGETNTGGASMTSEGNYDSTAIDFAALPAGQPAPGNRYAYQDSDTSNANPNVGSPYLMSGQTLTSGQEIGNVVNGYSLNMQTDGNLVLTAPGNNPVWSLGTQGNPGDHATMQGDGNLVVATSSGVALKSTNTSGNPGAFFTLQQDDNGVVYSASDTALYTTNTCQSCS